MHAGKFALRLVVLTMILAGMQAAAARAADLDNASCLACHGNPDFAAPGANGQMRSLAVPADQFGHSVHGNLQCVACHTEITDVPHQNAPMTPAAWRQQIPKLCGSCHADALNAYLELRSRQAGDGGE